MKLLLIITIIITLIQVVRVSTCFLRKDASIPFLTDKTDIYSFLHNFSYIKLIKI